MTYMTSQAEKHYNELDAIERFDEMLLDKIEHGEYELNSDMVNDLIADAPIESLKAFIKALIVGNQEFLKDEYKELRAMSIDAVLNQMKEELQTA